MASDSFSGVVALILSVADQHKATTAQHLSSALVSKETKQVLESSSPDELLSCVQLQLDAREHQLGVLYILDSVVSRKKAGDGTVSSSSSLSLSFASTSSPLAIELTRLAIGFLQAARPNDYMCTNPAWSKKLCSLCVAVAKVAVSEHIKAAILPLCNGLECLTQGNVERITPLNSVLIELCVVCKCYTTAVGLMGDMPSLYEPERFGTKLRDLLGYFVHSGTALLALKRYEDSADMFKGALMMPLSTPHPLITTAAKKYLLACVIFWGEEGSMPPYMSGTVKKTMMQDIPDYQGLVQRAFALRFDCEAKMGVSALREYIKEKDSTWRADGNEALVAFIAENTAHKMTLKRFVKTYTAVPKDVLMNSLGVGSSTELDAVVIKFCMVNGAAAVRIDDEAGVVHFDDQSEKLDMLTMQKLMKLIQQTVDAKKAVDEDWLKIETSDLFRKHTAMGRAGVEGGRGDRMKKGPGMVMREGSMTMSGDYR